MLDYYFDSNSISFPVFEVLMWEKRRDISGQIYSFSNRDDSKRELFAINMVSYFYISGRM